MAKTYFVPPTDTGKKDWRNHLAERLPVHASTVGVSMCGFALTRPRKRGFEASGYRSFFIGNCSPTSARLTKAPQNGVGV